MKLACDLHIHSCLSPCGDALMTPNNIVGMAYIKELVKQRENEDNAALSIAAEEPAPYYTKAEILAGFDEACKELKAQLDGKLEFKPAEQLLNEL